jgi:hypothetical protein
MAPLEWGTCQTSEMGGDAIIIEITEPTEIGGPLFCQMETKAMWPRGEGCPFLLMLSLLL